MSLLDVRTQFIEESGRFDLVVDAAGNDYSDDGADHYINAGQRYLDRLLDFPKQAAEVSHTITQGEFTHSIPNLRALQRVRKETSDGVDYLDRLSLQEAQEDYGADSTLANADTGEPTDYAIGIKRTDTASSANETEKKILILPPADGSYDLVFEVLLESPQLSNDSDVSFWTEEHPHLLVMAAQMSLEESYRNTSGTQDWKRAIRDRVQGIDFDEVAESAGSIDQMEDSWNERPFINL